MKTIRYYMLPACVLLMVLACKKSELLTFEGERSLYFDYNPIGFTTDSVLVSFGLTPDTKLDSLVKVPLKMIGLPLAQAAPYELSISGGKYPAVAGRDYELSYSKSFPPGKSIDTVEVKFLKSALLSTQQLELILEVKANKDFRNLFYGNLTRTRSPRIRLFVNNMASPPAGWFNTAAPTTAGEYYLGRFTRKKFMLLFSLYGDGDTQDDFYNNMVLYRVYYGNLFSPYLREQRAAGNVIYEDDGSEMKVGPYYN